MIIFMSSVFFFYSLNLGYHEWAVPSQGPHFKFAAVHDSLATCGRFDRIWVWPHTSLRK